MKIQIFVLIPAVSLHILEQVTGWLLKQLERGNVSKLGSHWRHFHCTCVHFEFTPGVHTYCIVVQRNGKCVYILMDIYITCLLHKLIAFINLYFKPEKHSSQVTTHLYKFSIISVFTPETAIAMHWVTLPKLLTSHLEFPHLILYRVCTTDSLSVPTSWCRVTGLLLPQFKRLRLSSFW